MKLDMSWITDHVREINVIIIIIIIIVSGSEWRSWGTDIFYY